VTELLNQALQLDLPINKFIGNKVLSAIKNLDLQRGKAPGYDLIAAKIMKELPEKGILFLMQLFNAIV